MNFCAPQSKLVVIQIVRSYNSSLSCIPLLSAAYRSTQTYAAVSSTAKLAVLTYLQQQRRRFLISDSSLHEIEQQRRLVA